MRKPDTKSNNGPLGKELPNFRGIVYPEQKWLKNSGHSVCLQNDPQIPKKLTGYQYPSRATNSAILKNEHGQQIISLLKAYWGREGGRGEDDTQNKIQFFIFLKLLEL